MKPDRARKRVCPVCGKTFRGVPALSREDNQTPICPECGTREALAALGIDEKEVEQIIMIIREHSSGFDDREGKE